MDKSMLWAHEDRLHLCVLHRTRKEDVLTQKYICGCLSIATIYLHFYCHNAIENFPTVLLFPHYYRTENSRTGVYLWMLVLHLSCWCCYWHWQCYPREGKPQLGLIVWWWVIVVSGNSLQEHWTHPQWNRIFSVCFEWDPKNINYVTLMYISSAHVWLFWCIFEGYYDFSFQFDAHEWWMGLSRFSKGIHNTIETS